MPTETPITRSKRRSAESSVARPFCSVRIGRSATTPEPSASGTHAICAIADSASCDFTASTMVSESERLGVGDSEQTTSTATTSSRFGAAHPHAVRGRSTS